MQVRSALVRGGIAVLAAAAGVMVAAPAALADDGAARGRVAKDAGAKGFSVNLDHDQPFVAELFVLKLSDGSKLRMYCSQIDVALRTDVDMVERPWNKYPQPGSPFHDNSAKINWVLHHGYPANDLGALKTVLDKKGITLHDGLSKEEAITATQAAVWHFSDNKNIDTEKPLPYESADEGADVLALYDYLTGKDNTGIGQQPKPTLNIGADKTKGAQGTKIGPFTVATTGEITDLTSELPDGAKLTGADGNEVKAADVKDGTKLFVDVAKDTKDGNGSFTLKASGELDTGRLFVSEDFANNPAQTLIVAQSDKTQVTAKATASWAQGAAAPSTTPGGAETGQGGLANTGVSATLPLTVGGLLLGGGVLMLLVVRRRRES